MDGLGQEGAGQCAEQADGGLAGQEDGADPAEDSVGDDALDGGLRDHPDMDPNVPMATAAGSAVTSEIGDVFATALANTFASVPIALLWSCCSGATNSWGESPALCLHRRGTGFVLSFLAEWNCSCLDLHLPQSSLAMAGQQLHSSSYFCSDQDWLKSQVLISLPSHRHLEPSPSRVQLGLGMD